MTFRLFVAAVGGVSLIKSRARYSQMKGTHMYKLTGLLFAVLALVGISDGASAATLASQGYVSVGGVDLNNWCKHTFGAEFKSVLNGTTAGDWSCQRNANDRRPISVTGACRLQYANDTLKAEALGGPGSWLCWKPGPVQKGVNLNAWCQHTFGAEFKSVVNGTTAGDWSCQRNANDRRPISVKDACILQYGNSVKQAKALNWNDPGSWVCVF
jgi:hypothetical protein